MTQSSIKISHLHKRFAAQSRAVIADLSLSLPPATCLSLLGPSGCGKTTLLRLLMGLEAPSAGEIVIAPELAARMAFVFQEPRLVPWRNALENVLLPLELKNENNSEAKNYARELLDLLGLRDFMQHFPAELSGGMQMRTALARALVTRPHLLLLDEPFAALDERTRFRLQDLLLQLKQSLSLQYVFVTHSISEAIYLGDQVLLMNDRGQQQYLQIVALGNRTQDVKLSAPFTDIAAEFSRQFAAIEQSA
jgi:NitT/TauT family transport system ATP-binding protein